MNEENVTCKEVCSHICESLGEELNSPRCAAIRAHLEGCTVCQNYFQSVEKTISFYRDFEIQMPDQAHDRLLKMLNLEGEQ